MFWWEVIEKLSLHESPDLDDEDDDDGEEEEGLGGGQPAKPMSISAEVLPEDLRGLPEAEIKFHLGRMVDGLRKNNETVRSLQEQLEQFKRAPKEEQKEPPKPKKPLDEMILEDPEAAIMDVLEKAGLVDRFARVEKQVGDSVFSFVASKIPDFDEYEDDVREILDKGNLPKTQENVLGALEMVIGRRILEEKARGSRKKQNTHIPKDDSETKKTKGKLPELHGLEKEIFSSSGMTREEWERHKKGGYDIEVPTS